MVSEHPDSASDESREVHERVVLPLVVPMIVFLFTLLVVYGLSRIFLEISDVDLGGTTLATPLAIGVALAILAAAWFMASTPRLQQWQVASIVLVAVGLLTGGGIIAAVLDEDDGAAANGAAATAEPTLAAGTVAVALSNDDGDLVITPSVGTTPAGSVTFNVTNDGGILHNLRVIRTDLPPGDLPTDGGKADESRLDVVGSVPELNGGENQELVVELAPGSYVLICNVPGHYLGGMTVAFAVE